MRVKMVAAFWLTCSTASENFALASVTLRMLDIALEERPGRA